MELQTIAPCCSIASLVYCSLTWPDPIFEQGLYRLQHKRAGATYTASDNTLHENGVHLLKAIATLHYTADDKHPLWLRSVQQMVARHC